MEILGISVSLVEDPVQEESPPNLVLYMYLRMFAYSSNILIASFDPMSSTLSSGNCKNQVLDVVTFPREPSGGSRIGSSRKVLGLVLVRPGRCCVTPSGTWPG